MATAGAAKVLGVDHHGKVDLWHARLAIKTLRRDQREAIAEVGNS